MNYVDFLEESAKSSSVPFLEFLRSQAPGTLHMFVEGGGDVAFYRHFVLRHFDKFDQIHIHECGGKPAVYETRRAIVNREGQPDWVKNMTLLFFVDRDLSDFLDQEYETAREIFVTDYYSIENYVVSPEMVSIILMDMFVFPLTVRLTPEEIADIKQKFIEQLYHFYELVRPIMAWGLFHKRKKTSFQFSDINLNKLIDFDENLHVIPLPQYTSRHLFEVLDALCKISSMDFTLEAHNEIIERFASAVPKTYIRGKFELWFLHKFASRLARQLRQKTGQRIRYKENLMSQDDLMVSLGPRVHPIPPSLSYFLSSNIPTSSEEMNDI